MFASSSNQGYLEGIFRPVESIQTHCSKEHEDIDNLHKQEEIREQVLLQQKALHKDNTGDCSPESILRYRLVLQEKGNR